jgi:magnesium-transporting ATPase (P-type)
MNLISRTATNIAHSLGIHPHDGKRVIFIRDENFHRGEVVGSIALTGAEKLSNIDRNKIIEFRNEAAVALGVAPARIQRRLSKGEMIMYRERGELK